MFVQKIGKAKINMSILIYATKVHKLNLKNKCPTLLSVWVIMGFSHI